MSKVLPLLDLMMQKLRVKSYFNMQICSVKKTWFLPLTKFFIKSAVMALEEQRAYIKIRSLLGVTPTDIKADLDTVYGHNAVSYITITRWCRRFKEGRESIEDDPRPGRPLSEYKENDVIAVKKMIDEDARYTVEEISESLSINSGTVFQILKQNLRLRKICARWVPHLLSQNEKDRRVKIASELLLLYDGCDERRLFEVVTGDETWISFFEPEGKENNKVWIGENGARPQIARRSKSVKRIMYALFFDARGIVARVPVPEHKTVTGIVYAEKILPAVIKHYMEARPRTGVRGLRLLHDNAPAHCSALVQDYLKTHGLKTLPHPAYSPDLSPCDFWLNPLIKKCLKGRRFETRTAVGRALFQCTEGIPKSDYRNALVDWIRRLKKCVEVKGEYFEGLD